MHKNLMKFVRVVREIWTDWHTRGRSSQCFASLGGRSHGVNSQRLPGARRSTWFCIDDEWDEPSDVAYTGCSICSAAAIRS